MITNILLSLSVVVVSWLLGVRSGYQLRCREVERQVKEYIQQSQETAIPPEVTMVKEGDLFYVYTLSDNKFLCQGRNHEEVLNSMAVNHPGKTFTISADTVRRMQEVGYK